jgi:hypothetical protein
MFSSVHKHSALSAEGRCLKIDGEEVYCFGVSGAG